MTVSSTCSNGFLFKYIIPIARSVLKMVSPGGMVGSNLKGSTLYETRPTMV